MTPISVISFISAGLWKWQEPVSCRSDIICAVCAICATLNSHLWWRPFCGFRDFPVTSKILSVCPPFLSFPSFLRDFENDRSLSPDNILTKRIMPLITPPIKNISEVTEPLKEQILKGNVHTIEEMKAWLKPLGYSDTINDAAINYILREFVMSKISYDTMCNMDMIVELLRPQLEVTKEYNK